MWVVNNSPAYITVYFHRNLVLTVKRMVVEVVSLEIT
jgi:hypothetical protein